MKTPIFAMRTVLFGLLLALTAAACGSDEVDTAAEDGGAEVTATEDTATASSDAEPAAEACPTITLSTYDSFAVSDGILEGFTAETCIEVVQVAIGDAGELVSSAILTKDNPTADVLYGIDNTFLQRGLDAGLFVPYESPALASVPAELQLDPEHRVTPIDFSDVCVNYWIDELPGEAPQTLDDLIDPANAGEFVTMDPETSSPGFALLLATIARYGDGWEDYWQALVDNDVSITTGWTEAYYGEFIAGGGSRSIVTSYASSPPAEVLFSENPIDKAPTGVLYDSCFRQVEFAGILDGTEHNEAARQLIDFLLSPTFQEDIPLNMFVYPANRDAALPDVFVEFGQLAEDPATLTPGEIEANREAWTERWVEIVLG